MMIPSNDDRQECMIWYTHLMGNALQTRQCEVGLVPILPVVLLELVQVGSQQLAHKEEVLLQVHACAYHHEE